MRAIYGCRAKGGGRGGRVRWAKNFSDGGRNLWRPRARVPKKQGACRVPSIPFAWSG